MIPRARSRSAKASEAPALSFLCARSHEMEIPTLRLDYDSEREFCSCTKRQEFSPFYPYSGREAEGEGPRMRLIKRRASKRFNPELKLPWLMSAKN